MKKKGYATFQWGKKVSQSRGTYWWGLTNTAESYSYTFQHDLQCGNCSTKQEQTVKKLENIIRKAIKSLIACIAVKKLSPETCRKWAVKQTEFDASTEWDTFEQFLIEEIKVAQVIEKTDIANPEPRDKRLARKVLRNCVSCPANHFSGDCAVYNTWNETTSFVHEHKASTCPSTSCKRCSPRFHTSLCQQICPQKANGMDHLQRQPNPSKWEVKSIQLLIGVDILPQMMLPATNTW